MFRWKLHTKFLIFVLGSVILVLGTLSYLFIRREARLINQKNIETRHVLAFAFAADLAESMIEGRPRSTLNMMQGLRERFNLARLEVLRRDGSLAFGRAGGKLDIPRLAESFVSGREIDFQETNVPPLNTIVIPLKNDANCKQCHGGSGPVLGAVLVSISREEDIREIIRSRRNLSLLFTSATVLIGVILYFMIRKVVLDPLAQLHQGAERLGRGDLTHRIALPTRDELQDLALSFNTMAGRIEEAYSGLEDGIHERTAQLQTALGEIRDKAGRLYAYSREMATISRLSTKIFSVDISLDELLDRFIWSLTRGLGYRSTMLCLVDRKRVWLDVKRDTGLGATLPFQGRSLLSDDPVISLVRKNNIEVLDRHALANAGIELRDGAPGDFRELYFIPLLHRKRSNRCWQATSCIRTDCPAYSEETIPCWLVENTLCGNPIRESYGSKLAYCMTCQMFPVIGVLIVAADERRQPSRIRNVGVLRILAAAMASALENHRLHEANQQMVRELLELHRVTAAALAELSLMKALEVFTDSALKFSGLDACNFWIVSPDGRELVRKAGGCVDRRDNADDFPERLAADSGLLGHALLQRNNFVIDYDVPTHYPALLGPTALSSGMRSLLAIPLKSEGNPLGVFTVHKRGTMPFLETEVAAFMLLANQAAMAVNVCMLSEELKIQNRELARHTGLLSGILSNMSSGIMLLDRKTTVALINQVGAEILHSSRDVLLNKPLSSLFPETSAFASSDVGSYQEMEIRLNDGATVPIGYSKTFSRSAPGEPESIIVVFRDLSEIKTLQAELLNKERFAAMGKVVAGVAHEIRNPLFGISSVGQILEREIQNPAHLELIRALLSESRRMNELVEELLLYGRPMKLNPEYCDVAAIWGEVINMHRGELERKQLVISGDLQVKQMTLLDANQIRQVFLNLLRNAIDATDQGGVISFRLLLDDRSIIVIISDTGRGIPSGNLDKIFDLFFTTKPKGTGLGLGICKKIVQDHGGDITVTSEEGKGATFTIRLPHRGVLEGAAAF